MWGNVNMDENQHWKVKMGQKAMMKIHRLCQSKY